MAAVSLFLLSNSAAIFKLATFSFSTRPRQLFPSSCCPTLLRSSSLPLFPSPSPQPLSNPPLHVQHHRVWLLQLLDELGKAWQLLDKACRLLKLHYYGAAAAASGHSKTFLQSA